MVDMKLIVKISGVAKVVKTVVFANFFPTKTFRLFAFHYKN